MTRHVDTTPGGWRGNVLMDAVAGIRPIDLALHLVGLRSGPDTAQARQDLTDAITAYRAGDHATAMAVATHIAEELQRTKHRRPAA